MKVLIKGGAFQQLSNVIRRGCGKGWRIHNLYFAAVVEEGSSCSESSLFS